MNGGGKDVMGWDGSPGKDVGIGLSNWQRVSGFSEDSPAHAHSMNGGVLGFPFPLTEGDPYFTQNCVIVGYS